MLPVDPNKLPGALAALGLLAAAGAGVALELTASAKRRQEEQAAFRAAQVAELKTDLAEQRQDAAVNRQQNQTQQAAAQKKVYVASEMSAAKAKWIADQQAIQGKIARIAAYHAQVAAAQPVFEETEEIVEDLNDFLKQYGGFLKPKEKAELLKQVTALESAAKNKDLNWIIANASQVTAVFVAVQDPVADRYAAWLDRKQEEARLQSQYHDDWDTKRQFHQNNLENQRLRDEQERLYSLYNDDWETKLHAHQNNLEQRSVEQAQQRLEERAEREQASWDATTAFWRKWEAEQRLEARAERKQPSWDAITEFWQGQQAAWEQTQENAEYDYLDQRLLAQRAEQAQLQQLRDQAQNRLNAIVNASGEQHGLQLPGWVSNAANTVGQVAAPIVANVTNVADDIAQVGMIGATLSANAAQTNIAVQTHPFWERFTSVKDTLSPIAADALLTFNSAVPTAQIMFPLLRVTEQLFIREYASRREAFRDGFSNPVEAAQSLMGMGNGAFKGAGIYEAVDWLAPIVLKGPLVGPSLALLGIELPEGSYTELAADKVWGFLGNYGIPDIRENENFKDATNYVSPIASVMNFAYGAYQLSQSLPQLWNIARSLVTVGATADDVGRIGGSVISNTQSAGNAAEIPQHTTWLDRLAADALRVIQGRTQTQGGTLGQAILGGIQVQAQTQAVVAGQATAVANAGAVANSILAGIRNTTWLAMAASGGSGNGQPKPINPSLASNPRSSYSRSSYLGTAVDIPNMSNVPLPPGYTRFEDLFGMNKAEIGALYGGGRVGEYYAEMIDDFRSAIKQEEAAQLMNSLGFDVTSNPTPQQLDAEVIQT